MYADSLLFFSTRLTLVLGSFSRKTESAVLRVRSVMMLPNLNMLVPVTDPSAMTMKMLSKKRGLSCLPTGFQIR